MTVISAIESCLYDIKTNNLFERNDKLGEEYGDEKKLDELFDKLENLTTEEQQQRDSKWEESDLKDLKNILEENKLSSEIELCK